MVLIERLSDLKSERAIKTARRFELLPFEIALMYHVSTMKNINLKTGDKLNFYDIFTKPVAARAIVYDSFKYHDKLSFLLYKHLFVPVSKGWKYKGTETRIYPLKRNMPQSECKNLADRYLEIANIGMRFLKRHNMIF